MAKAMCDFPAFMDDAGGISGSSEPLCLSSSSAKSFIKGANEATRNAYLDLRSVPAYIFFYPCWG
jgi:hypothetical protein